MNKSSVCAPNGDAAVGPQVASCLRAFDFTLRFEDLFLSIIPSALFTFVALVRLYLLKRGPKLIFRGGAFQFLKLVRLSHSFLGPR